MLNGLMVAAGAALGVEDQDDALRQISMLMHAYREDNGRDYAAEVRTRNLEFGPPPAAQLNPVGQAKRHCNATGLNSGSTVAAWA